MRRLTHQKYVMSNNDPKQRTKPGFFLMHALHLSCQSAVYPRTPAGMRALCKGTLTSGSIDHAVCHHVRENAGGLRCNQKENHAKKGKNIEIGDEGQSSALDIVYVLWKGLPMLQTAESTTTSQQLGSHQLALLQRLFSKMVLVLSFFSHCSCPGQVPLFFLSHSDACNLPWSLWIFNHLSCKQGNRIRRSNTNKYPCALRPARSGQRYRDIVAGDR